MNAWQRATVALVFLGAGVALTLVLGVQLTRPPAPAASTPDVLSPGWTVTCDSAVIWFVCHTYPPGADIPDRTAYPPYRGPIDPQEGAR